MKKVLFIIIAIANHLITYGHTGPDTIKVHQPTSGTGYVYSYDASSAGKSIHHGSVFLLDSGTMNGGFKFSNLVGTVDSPIIIRNYAGHTTTINTSINYSSIWLYNCKYIKLISDDTSRFIINHTHTGAIAVAANGVTTDIEVSKINIINAGSQGLQIKTDPTCTVNIMNDTIYNLKIHDCAIRHTGCEGMYIGSTAFFGLKNVCSGDTEYPKPPVIMNDSVYNNVVKYSGWDGIQISNSKKTRCYNNKIYYDSRARVSTQKSGMMIGGGASGTWDRDTIMYGYGDAGIQVFGEDTLTISNCYIFINDSLGGLYDIAQGGTPIIYGDTAHYAIYINDKNTETPSYFYITNNNGQATRKVPVTSFNLVYVPNMDAKTTPQHISQTVQSGNSFIYKKTSDPTKW